MRLIRPVPPQLGANAQPAESAGAPSQDAVSLSSILDLSHDGLLAFDRQDRIIHVSANFLALTGLDRTQLTGMAEAQFWDCLSALGNAQQTRMGVAQLRQHLAHPEDQRRSVLELLRPVPRLLRVFLRTSDATDVARVLCFRDVTQEFDVDRRKSEFLSTAAHELRAPLASIYGFSESLLTQPCDAAMQTEFIGIIHQQAQVMAHLLDEMLDLARIEARRHSDFVFEQIPVVQLVQTVLSGFRRPLDREAPTLHAVLTDLQVRVDRKKAQQVLLNVLSNAYKYSPQGGSVDITIEAVRSTDTDAAEILIRICDQGIGMTPSQLSRVFERFYRANAVPGVTGTGLGMNIVQEIMQLLNGRIELQSEAGAGTCVSLYFPAV